MCTDDTDLMVLDRNTAATFINVLVWDICYTVYR